MGLEKTAAECLSGAKSLGADFTKSAMIGRQWLSVPQGTADRIAEIHGAARLEVSDHRFAEPFFQMLGATSVDSIDASPFEGATHIMDMNDPLPVHLKGQYGVVFDGGTLEHVFNAPQALKNCMEMVKPGGYCVHVLPGNNFMGHGFWQFSPELMYRVYSAENGFETCAVLVQEIPNRWREERHGRLFFARDPGRLGWRVELKNSWPTQIAVIARRRSELDSFGQWPQQSDYVQLWEAGSDHEGAETTPTIAGRFRAGIPRGLERWLRPPFLNKAYVPVASDDLMRGKLPS